MAITKTNAFSRVLEREGVSVPEIGWNLAAVSFDTSIKFFRFLLQPNDPRWGLVNMLCKAQQQHLYKPVHLEVALRAEYLSGEPSFRNKFSCYSSEPNIRQVCRALQNVSARFDVEERFQQLDPRLPDGYSIKLERTTNFTRKVAPTGITGCPEALYQLQIFEGKRYIGRTGFNLHREDDSAIVSIVNLQGVPGGVEAYQRFARYGLPMLNHLAKLVVDMFPEDAGYQIRGMKDPMHGPARPLYRGVFKAAGVQMFPRTKRHKD